jgi:hypothetical protein
MKNKKLFFTCIYQFLVFYLIYTLYKMMLKNNPAFSIKS